MPLPDGGFLERELNWYLINDKAVPVDLIERLSKDGYKVPALIAKLRNEGSKNAGCELVS